MAADWVKNHHGKIALVVFCCTLVLAALLFVQSLLYPGHVYCTSSECEDGALEPPVPDLVSIIVAGVVYVILGGLAMVIIKAPGFIMDNPYRWKLLSITAILIAATSLVQTIAPAANRAYILPLEARTDYTIDVSTSGDDEVTVQSTFNAPVLVDEDAEAVRVLVYELPSDSPPTRPSELTARSPLVASGDSDEDTELVASVKDGSGNLTISTVTLDASDFDDGKDYMIVVAPIDADGDVIGRPLIEDTSDSLIAGTEDSDRVLVDTRAFLLCNDWDATSGCT